MATLLGGGGRGGAAAERVVVGRAAGQSPGSHAYPCLVPDWDHVGGAPNGLQLGVEVCRADCCLGFPAEAEGGRVVCNTQDYSTSVVFVQVL